MTELDEAAVKAIAEVLGYRRCNCSAVHMPSGVICRWLTRDPDQICRPCRSGNHHQPAAEGGRHKEL